MPFMAAVDAATAGRPGRVAWSETGAVSALADLPIEPLSDRYGLDRGTPLDRRCIEAFLAERERLIRGSVLEVESDAHTTTFGADRVSKRTVVDLNRSNPRATLIADLEQPGSLPHEAYDCIILTQTLHLLRKPGLCLENCHQALGQSGALLVTAPSVSRVSPTYPDADYWRFTPAGIAELFSRHWDGGFTVHAKGNLRSCIGFLLGEVVEDVPNAVLDLNDPRFPLNVAVEAHKT
jgi:hypothetical protein